MLDVQYKGHGLLILEVQILLANPAPSTIASNMAGTVRDALTFLCGICIGAFLTRGSSRMDSKRLPAAAAAATAAITLEDGGEAGRGGGDGEETAADAIIVPAGGQTSVGPPPHVRARLEKAAEMYHAAPAARKPYVITTAWGTPHKPCPHDAAGFERHEAADNAKLLLELGVAAEHILEESVSLETVGNAMYTRVIHTDPAGLRRLVVINNAFHMPRTRAVFSFVFGLPAQSRETAGADADAQRPYTITYVEVPDHLPADVLRARLDKERVATPRFAPGGPWRAGKRTLRDMWHWLHFENTAYAAVRLKQERAPLDPKLLRSY